MEGGSAAAQPVREITATRRLSRGGVLAVASAGAFLAFLDATIVNVAFPAIRGSFPGHSISALSWVLNAYNIAFAAFLLVAGRFAVRLIVVGVHDHEAFCGLLPSGSGRLV